MLELLNLKDINKKYGIKQTLKNINLNIESGKIIGVLGPISNFYTAFMCIFRSALQFV